jgi:AraC family transcriptional regulator
MSVLQSTLCHSDGVSIRALAASAGSAETCATWRLCYYAPGLRMPRHTHDVAQFSILVAGSERETTAHGAFDFDRRLMEVKPAGFAHENEFGPDGALRLSINLSPEDDVYADHFDLREWRLASRSAVRSEWSALAAALAKGGSARLADLEALTADLLAALADEADFLRSSPPRWLSRAAEAARETDLDFRTIAADAGVHRVHLARAFRRHYGLSLTEHRRRARLGTGIRRLVHERASPALAGIEAGFADQSHFTRSLKGETGLTPAALARLFLR